MVKDGRRRKSSDPYDSVATSKGNTLIKRGPESKLIEHTDTFSKFSVNDCAVTVKFEMKDLLLL